MKVITIGRAKEGNNIVINDIRVSRNHLQIILDDDGSYYAIDLDSTNGTYVNGKRITNRVLLKEGDTIVIGTTTLKWEQYFKDSNNPNNHNVPYVPNDPIPTKKRYRTIIIILALLLISIIVAMIYISIEREQDIDDRERYNVVLDSLAMQKQDYLESRLSLAEQNSKENQEERNKAVAAAAAAESQMKEATKERERALEDAKKAENERERAMKKADEAKDEKNKADAERREAIEAKKAAEKQVEQAEKQVEQAKEDAKKAEQKLKDLERQTMYTEEFYDLLDKMHSGIFNSHKKSKQVCDSLSLDVDKKNPTEVLKEEFKNADISRKEMIIRVMQSIIEISQPELEKSQKSSAETDSNRVVNKEDVRRQDEQATQQSGAENLRL